MTIIGTEEFGGEPVQSNNRNSAIAAAVIVVGFGVAAFYLPTLILAIGKVSTLAAGSVAVLFVAAFFLVFWLRGRAQNRKGG